MLNDYLDALLSLPDLWGAKVSPDGKWVAWVWMGVGETSDVFAAPTDGSQAPIKLTASDENTFLTSWTLDSKGVLVAQDHDGDERYRLFRVDVAQPEVMQPLIEADPNYFLRGGDLHPNGRWLIYGANVDENGNEIEPTWVYRQDLETEERTPLARTEQGGYVHPRLSPMGTHILYGRRNHTLSGYPLWLVDIDGYDDREIVNVGDDKKVEGTWFPDGRRVLVVAETDTHNRVGVWSLDDGSLRWIVDDPNRNIEDAYVPFGSDEVVLIEIDQARACPSLLNVTTGVERKLPDERGNLYPLAPTTDGAWVGKYANSQQPTDLVRFVLSDTPEQFVSLTRIWEQTSLKPDDFTAAEDYRWQSEDGLAIQGWLYRARGEAKGTVVYVHGGPTWHHEDQITPDIQFFAAAGFNVLDPNYRGSTGFSLAYRESIKEDGWGGREQVDIRTGVEKLIADGIAEAGKVGITGTSYGGYSSWHAITHFAPEIIAASAPICGMTDLVVDYETTRPDLRPYSAEMMGGSPEQVPERYAERSPIHFVQNIAGRLLIVQGLQDPNVSPENVRTVRVALDREGIEYQMLVFDDEGHGISRIPNQKTLLLRLAEFFSEAFSAT